MRLSAWFTLLVLLPACSSPRPPASAADIKPEPYVRINDADTNLIQLQIAVRRFVPAHHRGPAVWLTAVSHIGETNYFARLQEHLAGQRLVLFEGISDHSPSGSAPVAESRGAGGGAGSNDGEAAPSQAKLSSLQSTMAASFGLAFQLDAIDYVRPNFRNSDLSVQELRRLLAEQGGAQSFESLLQMMQGGSFFDALIQVALRFLGTSPKFQAMSKLALMEMIGQIQGDPGQIRGLPPELKKLLQVLIERRNEKVIDDLKAELGKKDRSGSISIFFGTGHMPDFEKRLRSEFSYRPAEQEWLTAFSVNLRQAGVSRADVEMVRKFVGSSLDQFKGKP